MGQEVGGTKGRPGPSDSDLPSHLPDPPTPTEGGSRADPDRGPGVTTPPPSPCLLLSPSRGPTPLLQGRDRPDPPSLTSTPTKDDVTPLVYPVISDL